MNTSSFFSGVLIGAAATTLMSKNKGNIGQMADKAKDKVMDVATSNMGINLSDLGSVFTNESHHSSGSHSQASSSLSKDSSINMVKDFIRTHPDVKQEVDQILKETNTVIPGL